MSFVLGEVAEISERILPSTENQDIHRKTFPRYLKTFCIFYNEQFIKKPR